jgi:hypothetical protein
MKGCMDHIHPAIKVSIQKVSLAYCFLVVVPAKVTNQSKPEDQERPGGQWMTTPQ